MEPEYEIQTMQKDIDRLAKQTAANEPISTQPSEPMVSAQVELPKQPESIEESPRTKKVFISIVLVIAILVVGAGFYYWWNYLRGPEKIEPEIPISIIEVDETKIIEIEQVKGGALFEKLEGEASKFQPEGYFLRILVKKTSREKDYFLPSQEIFEALGINLPADILSNLNEDNTLFLYTQEQGNRLGIIIRAGDADNLKTFLNFWEATMVDDLKPLFLDKNLTQPAVIEFSDNTYEEVDIRYLNFIDSSLAIDYAIVGDYFVITTSKESMFKTIDKILTIP